VVRSASPTYNPGMDRDALRRFIASPHRTWRWREAPDDPDHYRAVETSDEGLRWYAWSHLPGEDGPYDEVRQSFAEFETKGPPWDVPIETHSALHKWLLNYLRAKR